MKDNTAWMQVFWTKINSAEPMFYVSEDGNYGGDHVMLLPLKLLTQEQIDRVGEFPDGDRLNYVKAVLLDVEAEFLADRGYE